MSDTKISAETAAATLTGTEALPGVQSAANVKITPAQIATYVEGRPNKWIVPPGGANAVAVVTTGGTTEVTLATITLAGGSIGANGILRVSALFSMTGTTTKTLRFRLGGISGSIFMAVVNTTGLSHALQRTVQNRNAQNSQISQTVAEADSWSNAGTGVFTMAVDTSVAQDLVITGQLTTGAESITLESYVVEICKRT